MSDDITAKLAEALRKIAGFGLPDEAAIVTHAREALAQYEQAKPAEPVTVDCIGLALDLEARAKKVDSQTTQRAMEAAAHGLRLLAAPVAQVSQQAAPEPWQPIETAPKDGRAILVNAGGFSYSVEWSEEVDWWCVDDNKLGPFRLRGYAPTHWMPLPQPPKEKP